MKKILLVLPMLLLATGCGSQGNLLFELNENGQELHISENWYKVDTQGETIKLYANNHYYTVENNDKIDHYSINVEFTVRG